MEVINFKKEEKKFLRLCFKYGYESIIEDYEEKLKTIMEDIIWKRDHSINQDYTINYPGIIIAFKPTDLVMMHITDIIAFE